MPLQSLQAKLLALLLTACLLIAAVGLWGEMSQHGVVTEYKEVVMKEYALSVSLDHLHIDFKTQIQEWKNLLLRGQDATELDKYWQAFLASHKKVATDAQGISQQLASQGRKGMLDDFMARHAALLPKFESAKALYVNNNFDSHQADAAVQALAPELSQILGKTIEAIDASSREKAAQLDAHAQRIYTLTLVVGLVVTLATILGLVLAVSKIILAPLNKAIAQVHKLAQGDYSVLLLQDRQDELGQLYASLEKLREALGGMIGGIRTTASVLLDATGQLNLSAQGSSKDTEATESCSGQIATAIHEMTATVNEVARNASCAAEATVRADVSASSGTEIMSTAIRSIAKVADEVAQTSTQMNRLKDESTSVGAVLDVIKGIAEQTNLLALNAAIEAARAGEQGRGFAVVADEVRALAKRTQESTEEIQQIIKALQDGASAAAQAMLQSTGRTRESVQLAEKAGSTLVEISTAIGLIRDMNNQIAAAAEEQSAASDEIHRNVVRLSDLAEKAHGHSRKTGSVAQGLEQTSRDLQSMVAGFRI
jgi:methyl-accepting chemotaxis protein